MNHYVYEITNLINGKKYIGKRSCKCNIEDDKYMGSGYALKKAMKVHGKENFTKEILIVCETEEEAFAWEDFYTMQVNAWDNRMYYNLKRGGKGGTTELNEESKRKIGLANKKHWENIELRKRMSEISRERNTGTNNPMYGKHHSYDTKMKIRKSKIGKKMSQEARNKISLANKGKFLGEEHHMYGKTFSKETRLKMSISRTGQKRSEETKRKMSLASKGRVMPKKSESKNSVSVVCLNTGEVFGSMIEAEEKYGILYTSISKCCRGINKSAISPITGEKTYWIYESNYISNKENNYEGK